MAPRLSNLITILALLPCIGCGGESGPSAPAPDVPVIEVLPPDPDGMLLPGAETDPAIDATVWLAPTAVEPDAMDGSRLTTRLVAAIAPNATVGDVNDALVAADAAIVSMIEGDPLVVLAVDAIADASAARQRAADLIGTRAFVYARPGSTSPGRAIVKSPPRPEQPGEGAVAWFTHLEPSRVPAVWNLRAAATHSTVLVLPHSFGEGLSVPEIANFSLDSTFGGLVRTADLDFFATDANEGFHVAGVATADWDHDANTSPHTGVDAAAAVLTTVQGIGTFGLDETEKVMVTALGLYTHPRQILLVAETFEDPGLRRIDKAWVALRWRHALQRFLRSSPAAAAPVTIAAGGSEETAAAVATVANLIAYAATDSEPDEQQALFDSYEAWASANPAVGLPVPHVLTVGSSNESGSLSSFSDATANVRAVGENVLGPCVVPSACATASIPRSTPGAAAAQIAGLASYLWHMDDTLSAENLLLRLQHAYSTSVRPGVLDAFVAALSLDSVIDPQFAPMRLALLDVASGPGVWGQDGRFDHRDIEVLLDAFEAFPGTYRDWSRFDLNGDGITGTGTARVDLDADILPSFETVTQQIRGGTVSFDENAVTDQDVLCYYAYSDLYQGDAGVRDALLVDCAGPAGTVRFDGTPQREVRVDTYPYFFLDSDRQELAGPGSAEFDVALDNSRTLDGGDAAHTAASAQQTSTIDLTGVSATGTQTASFRATNPNFSGSSVAEGAPYRADFQVIAFSRSRLRADFVVEGGRVPFTLDLGLDLDATGTNNSIAVTIEVDGDETGGVGRLATSEPGSDGLQLSGVLEPDEYTVWVEIVLNAEMDYSLPEDEGEITCTWNLDLRLAP